MTIVTTPLRRIAEYLQRVRRAPEEFAAAVNALLVLLVPVVMIVAATVASWNPDHTVTARVTPLLIYLILKVLELGVVFTPFVALAFIAAWRTWVHARRYLSGQGSGWQGVGEGGTLGLLVAVLVLSPGIVAHPTAAPPYVVAYGGFALILGVTAGLLLRTSALFILRRSARR